jgi:EREBP-like factor
MCGGAILSGLIPPSGVPAAAAAAKKKQQRRATADLLWPGPGKKGAPREEDFEADFREFERGLGEDDVDGAGDEVQELPLPEPARLAFAAAVGAPRTAVGEHRAMNFFFLSSILLVSLSHGMGKDVQSGG